LPGLLAILTQFTQLIQIQGAGHGQINLTGGEPFLRDDLFGLLEAIVADKTPLGFSILTNGTFIDRAMARRLRQFGPKYVQISIDGRKETHDSIRGAGDFERAVAAVRELVRATITTLISFTAHRGNYRDFPAVARLGRRLRVARVWADRLIPAGSGSHLESLNPDETREFLALMRSAREKSQGGWLRHTEIPLHRSLQFLEGGMPYRCSAGSTLITILSNGDVVPCRRLPIRVGNVFENSLVEIYRESPLLRDLRDQTRQCRGCESCRFLNRCRGGLRCLAFAVTGDPFSADPGCWLASRSQG
jgi:radical SAM protein with 4Fe4S-binding SPASM domain